MSEHNTHTLPGYTEKHLSNVTGNDVCFHCHSIGVKCTRIDGGYCRIGREAK